MKERKLSQTWAKLTQKEIAPDSVVLFHNSGGWPPNRDASRPAKYVFWQFDLNQSCLLAGATKNAETLYPRPTSVAAGCCAGGTLVNCMCMNIYVPLPLVATCFCVWNTQWPFIAVSFTLLGQHLYVYLYVCFVHVCTQKKSCASICANLCTESHLCESVCVFLHLVIMCSCVSVSILIATHVTGLDFNQWVCVCVCVCSWVRVWRWGEGAERH